MLRRMKPRRPRVVAKRDEERVVAQPTRDTSKRATSLQRQRKKLECLAGWQRTYGRSDSCRGPGEQPNVGVKRRERRRSQ